MTAVPTTLVAVAGAVLTASQWNTNNAGVENWLLAPAIMRIRQTTGQSLTNATAVPVLFDTEDVDSTNMHSIASNTSRATAVYPGWYLWSGNNPYGLNATGIRTTAWQFDGGAVLGSGTSCPGSASDTARLGASPTLIFCNVGDYVELLAFQTSGGALTNSATGSAEATMSAIWISN